MRVGERGQNRRAPQINAIPQRRELGTLRHKTRESSQRVDDKPSESLAFPGKTVRAAVIKETMIQHRLILHHGISTRKLVFAPLPHKDSPSFRFFARLGIPDAFRNKKGSLSEA